MWDVPSPTGLLYHFFLMCSEHYKQRKVPCTFGSPTPSVGIVAASLTVRHGTRTREGPLAEDRARLVHARCRGVSWVGKLHHHLGVLSREVEGEELGVVYHFVEM